jgi:CO/xanthine dehydrogenase Mo-binding subunit
MIRFGSTGNATLYVHAGPSGQGHETVLPEVVGELLGSIPKPSSSRRAIPPVLRSWARHGRARAA